MNILLAVDGENQSYEAVRALAHLARPDKVHLVHVMDVPVPMYPSMDPVTAKEIQVTVEAAMREEGERLLGRLASFLPPGMGSVSRHLVAGKPADIITHMAAQEGADLVVMGARGVGQIRELMLGSVSHRVVTHTACSVLVVRGAPKAIDVAVLAVESQEDAETAVRFLERQPFKLPCEVVVLTVMPYATPAWPVGAMIPETYRTMILSQATEFVTGIAAKLRAAGYRSTGQALLGSPAHEILGEAQKRRADLIILGSRHKGISRLLLGSVSHSVLHHAHCPVLVCR